MGPEHATGTAEDRHESPGLVPPGMAHAQPVADEKPAEDSALGAPVPDATVQPSGLARRLLLAARVVQVRLRFVAVLLVAFLVVGLWGSLRNYCDTLLHWIAGAHPVQRSVSTDTEYYCPMDPGVVSDWPAICPVCNMDLVRRKKGEALLLPEGVVARMQFSPYRIQAAGIKTSPVSRRALAREIVLGGRIVAVPGLSEHDSDDSALRHSEDVRFLLECEAFARDLPFLSAGRPAEVSSDELPAPARGTIVDRPGQLLPARRDQQVYIRLEAADAGLRAGTFCRARIAVPLEAAVPAAADGLSQSVPAGEFVAVPETAVIDTGSRRFVFVESMPGMFDGVEVTLGPRCGDFYPVFKGLEPGQKVATVGAFLIDAEARLSPNLAAAYFGASGSSGAQPTDAAAGGIAKAAAADKSKPEPRSKLTADDQELVKKQKICPVTELALDSMGGPIAVEVAGRKVFICCKGCESKLKQEPQKYLAKLKKQ